MGELNLESEELDRYSRHIFMDDIGADGQQKLLQSSVLVVGAGGLASPALQYLAAAGIGTIGLIDDDIVERSNLQRQTIHSTNTIDDLKVESAASYLEDLNPNLTYNTYDETIDQDNAISIIDEYDFVLDCSDNFPTRFLINDACQLTQTPFSNAAIYQFEGQAITVPPTDDFPCYRCLFPEAPPEGTIPDCATVGVLGVLPGVLGSIQATEAMKYILDIGELLSGQLLIYNAKSMTFDRVSVNRNSDCQICGTSPEISSIHDVEYSGKCTVKAK